jgi:acetyltransferase-like isoleucine patch superfamily enzyme
MSRHIEVEPRASAVLADRHAARSKYQSVVVGEPGLHALLRHEMLTGLLGGLPGALGFWARRKGYRWLFGRMRPGAVIGRGVTLRGPRRMQLGENVLVDDYCSLSVTGGPDARLVIGDRVFVGRFTCLSARDGPLEIGSGTNIGSFCRISAPGRTRIGKEVLIAAYCYIGAANHRFDRSDIPIAEQGMVRSKGVSVEDDVWIGAGVCVLDGVRIGKGAVVGAGAVVTRDVPPATVVVGVPAKPIRGRDASQVREGMQA